jgi:prepilin-type N-terminal cleavage/methylation domain-containing protein
MNTSSQPRGFSLVEVMAALAILGVSARDHGYLISPLGARAHRTTFSPDSAEQFLFAPAICSDRTVSIFWPRGQISSP